ncbi:hypothetical protein LOK49_LG05G02907 [Camellia lanceoleosa]|uniref:Uncharacterized protein n=1 Tax=Camellia lanceoleosa TaxID=1840588 RepID=A0ACC0HSB2_9ERIC|nr:hypothetical protein LOK49_LG05G02907 [Camellia lanceoleosa]
MSRVAKWKLEKTKVKVVFRLQFHATHVPQAGWDKLFISFIPADSGKATAKTTKANVRNGACKWGDPIYETTRLLQDSKSKQYDVKLYKFVVAMGSSRSSILGEASINLADFADALKPSIIDLPLHGCNCGTILHVNARVRFRPESKELPSLEEEAGLSEENADSAVGFDGSSNTSESLYAEKHDTSSTHEIDSLKSTVSGDLNGLSQSPREEKGDTSDHRILPQGSSDWVHGWSSDYSMDNDLAIVYEENGRLRGSLEVAESSVHELKLEVSSLQSHADEIGIETQKFSQQLAAEISAGEELAKEISVMQSECLKLKGDLEQLKSLKLTPQYASRETSNNSNQDHLFQGNQLSWLKGLLIMEDKIRELQNKVYLSFNDRDLRFLHSDLGELLIVLQQLKLGTGEAIPLLDLPSEITNVKEIRKMSSHENEQFVLGNGLDVDLYQPSDMLNCLSIPSIVSQEADSIGVTKAMEEKIFELLRELDEAKAERESFARKMDQMECYYEALVQELEENHKQMLGELQNLRNEHSTCLYTIATTSAEMESMRQDMNEQILRFTQERRDLDSINKDLEKRATTSEAALRRARMNYSIAVDHLQKDLDLLSFQVVSMFETNENLIKQTFSETSQLCFEGQPEAVRSLEEFHATKLLQYQNQNAGVNRSLLLGGDILLEDMKKSLLLQEGLYHKVEEELSEMHVANVHLDVFSKILQETLLEASAGVILMKKKIDEFAQQLDLSTESKKLLTLQLQTAMHEVQTLNEYKASCIAKCCDMDLQNQILKAKLESLSNENCLFTQKITEWEVLVRECRGYESKYEACFTEKTDLANLLKQETLDKGNLQNEITSLKEELETVKAECSGYESKYDACFTEKTELATLLKQETLDKGNLQNEITSSNEELETVKAECSGYESKYEACFTEKTDLANLLKQETLNRENLQNEISSLKEVLKTVKAECGGYESRYEACFAEKTELATLLTQETLDKGNLQNEISFLKEELGTVKAECSSYGSKYEACSTEKTDLENLLKQETLNKEHLENEISSLKEELKTVIAEHSELSYSKEYLQKIVYFLEDKLGCVLASYNKQFNGLFPTTNSVCQDLGSMDFEVVISQLEEIQHSACEKILQLLEEKKNLEGERDLAQVSSSTASTEMLATKQKFGHDIQIMGTKLEASNALVEKLQLELETPANKLHLLDDLALLEVELQQLTSKNMDLAKEILGLDTVTEELERSKLTIVELTQERQDLMIWHLSFDSLKENLRSLHDEFHLERSIRDNLEDIIKDLTSQLNEKHDHLLRFSQQDAELVHFRHLASDLELEKSRGCHILLQHEECLEKLREESSHLTDLESQLSEMRGYIIAADVNVIFTRIQYETRIEELSLKLQSSEGHVGDLSKKLFDVEEMLNRSLAGEAHCIKENLNLATTVESLRLDMMVQLEEYKKRVASLEVEFSRDKNEHSLEVKQLKQILVLSEEEIDNLLSSKEELDTTVTVLKAKLDELRMYTTSLQDYNDELMTLQNQCNELKHRLSKQILKTEEFKNLSIHFKDLKDKAEAECLQARAKREPEGPSVAMQDSLRIAFLKEQYETKIQELRHQLSISKKHGEEMLWKLQDAVDELENRKKSEASHLKRNEDLSVKILELEAELQSVVSEKREKFKAYDRIHAELECALLSLECCKEEKQRLEASLQECSEENNRIATELILTKGQLESFASNMNVQKEECNGFDELGNTSGDTGLGKAYKENPVSGTSSSENITMDTAGNDSSSTGRPFVKCSEHHNLMNREEVEDASLIPIVEGEHSAIPANVQPFQGQDVLIHESMHGISKHAFLEQGAFLHNDSKHLAVSHDHFKAQSLKSSMDQLHKELERMKNDNSLLPPLDDHYFDPNFQGLQTELMQLHKVNEELRNIFPVFNESGSGNALERVLALEIELAEALRAKKKSSIIFQSSFIKQHSDEQAIFQSFRDINELIKEMLELKGRYVAVESELKDMHGRYSQLSLQFAEVEGERQKLMMTLKNVRTSRKFMQLNRSSSDTLGDHPS